MKKHPEWILFIDELHTLVGAGATEGSMDAANIMKPALARGELRCIGATTLKEYKKYIEKDAALERRFQPVKVGEPTNEETVQILHGLRDKYEAFHKVKIPDEAIKEAVRLSSRYITDRFQPDKAIDVIRSIPFIILMVLLIPVSRALVGTGSGVKGAYVALIVGTVPFFARR